MLILCTIIVLSVMTNIPVYLMLRYSADPRNQLRPYATSSQMLDVPNLTFDSRGMV